LRKLLAEEGIEHTGQNPFKRIIVNKIKPHFCKDSHFYEMTYEFHTKQAKDNLILFRTDTIYPNTYFCFLSKSMSIQVEKSKNDYMYINILKNIKN
jgi:hypothetical protein